MATPKDLNAIVNTLDPENPDEILGLLKSRGGAWISIYLPLHKSPPDSDKNPIRVRNLFRKAKQRIRDWELGQEEIKKFDSALDALANVDPRNWLTHGPGLGLFMNRDGIHLIDLPYRTEEHVAVADQISVKPLIPLLSDYTFLYVLSLTQDGLVFHRVARTRQEPVDVPDLPRKLSDITWTDDPEKSVQTDPGATTSAPGRPGSTQTAGHHGQGLPSELEKDQEERYFNAVASAIARFLGDRRRTPLLVVGVESNLGSFRKHFDLPGHTVLTREQDPKNLDPDKRIALANETIDRLNAELRETRLRKLEKAFGENEGIFDIESAATAAGIGRADFAAVAQDQVTPGTCEPEQMKVHRAESTTSTKATDLLDYVAAQTLRYGGQVDLLPADSIPGDAGVAIIPRFKIGEDEDRGV